MEPAELLASTVDKSQVPPLHQKRIVAFINHFLINSCDFLNEFAEKCESKFIAIERKMQRIEVGLAIIEAKLASIANAKIEDEAKNSTESATATENETTNLKAAPAESMNVDGAHAAKPIVHAFEDSRYYPYFKMLRLGVLADAVKLKMRAEGVNPSILDTPNLELADGVKHEVES